MRGWPALGIVLLVLFAGCTSSDKPTSSSSTSGTATTHTTGTTASAPLASNRTNHPPTAALKATAYGLQANLTVSGSDPDQDALNWTLWFGDGNQTKGQVLPTNLTHAYLAGAYNLTLVVRDATDNATVHLHLVLNQTKAAFPPITVTGSAKLPCPQCATAGANTGVGYRSGQNGVDYFWSDIPATAAGQPFKLTSSGGNPDVSFRDGCSGGSAVGSGPFQAGGPEAGTVPAGAVCALMWEEQAPQSTFTLVIGSA